jgi:hypothetical protein
MKINWIEPDRLAAGGIPVGESDFNSLVSHLLSFTGIQSGASTGNHQKQQTIQPVPHAFRDATRISENVCSGF